MGVGVSCVWGWGKGWGYGVWAGWGGGWLGTCVL